MCRVVNHIPAIDPEVVKTGANRCRTIIDQPSSIPSNVSHARELYRPSDGVWHLYEQVTHVHTVEARSDRERITFIKHRSRLCRNSTSSIIGVNAHNSLLISIGREVSEILEREAIEQTVVQSQGHLVTKLLDAGKVGITSGSVLVNRGARSGHAWRNDSHETAVKCCRTRVGCRCSKHSITLGR